MSEQEKNAGNEELKSNGPHNSGHVIDDLIQVLISEKINSVLIQLKTLKLREVKLIIEELLNPLNEEELYVVASEIIKFKTYIVAAHFQYFKQTDIAKKIQIIDQIIDNDPVLFIQNFQNFEINDKETAYILINKILNKTYKDYYIPELQDDNLSMIDEIAKDLVYNFIEKICENFEHFGITNSEYINTISEKIKNYDLNLFAILKPKLNLN